MLTKGIIIRTYFEAFVAPMRATVAKKKATFIKSSYKMIRNISNAAIIINTDQ